MCNFSSEFTIQSILSQKYVNSHTHDLHYKLRWIIEYLRSSCNKMLILLVENAFQLNFFGNFQYTLSCTSPMDCNITYNASDRRYYKNSNFNWQKTVYTLILCSLDDMHSRRAPMPVKRDRRRQRTISEKDIALHSTWYLQ